jgi:hypothetical protein
MRHLVPPSVLLLASGTVLLLAFGACAHARPKKVEVDPASAPILPAPEARDYATGDSSPRDPLVRALVQGAELPWDEALSGAATTLALDPARDIELGLARQAAVRAGYPYPVVRVLAGELAAGEPPVELETAIPQLLQKGDQVGVVRARMSNGDRWVVLVGRPRMRLEPFPREIGEGGTLRVRGDRPGTFTLVSPTGRIERGALPLQQRLDEVGEWWVELRGAGPDRPLVSAIPVYVGIPTPPAAVIELPGEAARGPGEAVEIASELLDDLRGTFGLPKLQPDRILERLADLPLEQAVRGEWSREVGEERMRGAGFTGGPLAQLACSAPTVAACLDQLFTTTEGRAALLDPKLRLVGAAAQVETRGLTLILNLVSE